MEPNPLFLEGKISDSDLTPSLFELLAEEQLKDLFHPVVKYVLSYFAQRHPRYLLRVLNRHDEVLALLMLLLESYHLRKHNASTSQHFYQLHLTPLQPTISVSSASKARSRRRHLNRRQRLGMLFVLVGIPYLRNKGQGWYERLGGRPNEGDEPSDQAVTNVDKVFKQVYPYLNIAFDLGLLGYDIGFMFERTQFYRPWYRWLAIRLQRAIPDDTLESDPSIWSRLPPLLPPILLMLKLSQWWYSPASPRDLPTAPPSAPLHALIQPPRPLPILPTADILPLTPPHTPTDEDGPIQSYTIDKDEYGTCPLCRKKWQNPSILTSGWVVCWRCGWDALNPEGEEGDMGICPITGVEMARGDLRRVLV